LTLKQPSSECEVFKHMVQFWLRFMFALRVFGLFLLSVYKLKLLCMLQVDEPDIKDRGDSGISRSTRSSSTPSRHASSKWAYRTTNLHPGSETEGSERPSPVRKRPSLKLKQTPSKKKNKELPVLRGIPRVIRRVNTETMLMAGR
jgi:hypothetical protein